MKISSSNTYVTAGQILDGTDSRLDRNAILTNLLTYLPLHGSWKIHCTHTFIRILVPFPAALLTIWQFICTSDWNTYVSCLNMYPVKWNRYYKCLNSFCFVTKLFFFTISTVKIHLGNHLKDFYKWINFKYLGVILSLIDRKYDSTENQRCLIGTTDKKKNSLMWLTPVKQHHAEWRPFLDSMCLMQNQLKS